MKPNGPYVHDAYSRWFYETEAPFGINWMGVQLAKCPYDLFFYSDIINETRPDLIIETGTFHGGSALYLAHTCDIVGHGRVLSVDLKTDRPLPDHPRIDFLAGMSSTAKESVEYVAEAAHAKRCMVILDSAHNRKHVLKELELYHRFVSKGCYLIVEDTNVHGYPFALGDITDDGGPAEAIRDWQPKNKGFECDRRFERLGMTQNPAGYLLRVR